MSIKVGDTVQIKKTTNIALADWVGIDGKVEALGEEIAFVTIYDTGLKVPLDLLIKVEEPQESEPKRGDEITITRAQFKEIATKAAIDLMKETNTDDSLFNMALTTAGVLALKNAENLLFGEPSENA